MRKPAPDVMKGLAVVLMVQVHLTEVFALPEVYSSMTGRVSLFLGGPFAAPVFMAVMGYFLAASRKSTSGMLLRGLKIFFLGLVLNIALNFNLLVHIFRDNLNVDPWSYVFGADILFLAGLSIIFITLLKPLLGRNPLSYFGLAVLVSALSPLLPDLPGGAGWLNYIQALLWGHLWWSYFPLLPWMAYPLLGMTFYFFMEKYREYLAKYKNSAVWIGLLSGLLALLASPYAFRISTDLPAYYHHGFLMFLWNTAFLLFWTILISAISRNINELKAIKYLAWLGKNVTVFYVVQWIIIGNIGTAVYKTQFPVQLILWFVAIMTVTSLAVMLYLRLRGRIRDPLYTSG